ncbi:MAG TPA: manganese catalase family protein [Alphaproteobacteria bacterium]|nr:manganese catalase family protein [Alphaproteobacteria bacterium]
MFMHNKTLMHTVRVAQPDPRLASIMLEQFGGPQGELAAAMRYFTQALAESDPNRKDMLFDIATEELCHLEIIGNIIVMLTKGTKGKMAEGTEAGELLSDVFHGGESHTTSLLYGGPGLINSGGAPWTAAYIDTIGEPTADFRSNIAAESRAKIIYERLINTTDDPDLKQSLGFLMTREIAHQKSFEKALYSIEANFPPGKLPGLPEYANKYYKLSSGEEGEGPWNSGEKWERVDDPAQAMAVDGGDGTADVGLESEDQALFDQMTERLASDLESDPMTGAELGAGEEEADAKPRGKKSK